jgi:putative membrane protein
MKNKFPGSIPCVAVLFSLLALACANGAGSTLSVKDQGFVTKASQGGSTEIKESELAKSKSSNENVKALADMMITDHTKAGTELDTLVTAKGGAVSKEPDDEQKIAIQKLQAMDGAAFDKAFTENMVSDHKKVVALFEDAARNSDDAQLKAFAQKTLPTLKHHLMAAKKLSAQIQN